MAKRQNGDNQVLYLCEIGALLPPDALREGNGRKLRSTPLPWLKFRTPADTSPAGQRYSMRRQAVKADERGLAILGVYDELLAVFGGDRIAPLRGYLVNHHLRAASAPEIAMAIGCFDRELVAHAVEKLLDVGLLAIRPRPDFGAAIEADQTLAPHDDPPDEPDDDRAADAPQARRRRSRGRAGAAKRPKRAKSRRNPLARELPASGPQPADQRGSDLRPQTSDVKPDTPNPQTPTSASASPPPLSADGNGKTKDLKPSASARASPSPPPPDAEARDAETADPTRDTGPPPTAAGPPGGQTAAEPTTDVATRDGSTGEADTAGAETPDALPAAPAPHPPIAEPTQPTEADQGRGDADLPSTRQSDEVDMTWHAEAFAQQILTALYPTREDLVTQGRRARHPQQADEFQARELGCFRRAFDRALVGLGQVEAMRLIQQSLKFAARCHKLKPRGTRGQYWRWWFGQEAAALRRARPMASGPS